MSGDDGFTLDETTRLTSPHDAHLRVLSVSLTPIVGAAMTHPVTVKAQARIGSAEGCQLRLVDPTVSRIHCTVSVDAAAITLRDEGSTNGTYVGGLRIERAQVPPGTVVQVGGSAFRIDLLPTPTQVPLSSATSCGDLIGGSVAMRAVYAILERVGPTDMTVLLQGETGTGKDVAARALHALSKRASGPFLPIDCGAIPEQLFESELFGHVRGAFTGALGARTGVCEEANGGTLFLDEIGEMPLGLQAKLLRALETRTIRRVGANTATAIDVRIVAATNRSLTELVNAGKFREDLYYRLAVVEIELPPLRERRVDIPDLARHLYARLVRDGRAEAAHALGNDWIAAQAQKPLPGNVRELKNLVERAVALGLTANGAHLPRPSTDDEGPRIAIDMPLREARDAWINDFEERYVRTLLRATGGNVTRAAERAGVSRRFIQRAMLRLGLSREGAPEDDEEPPRAGSDGASSPTQ